MKLVDRYFEFRRWATKPHRDRTSGRPGHVCIFQVFEEAYALLYERQLQLTPLVSLGVASPQPTIYGLELGEEEDIDLE